MAGGYGTDIDATVAVHLRTIEEAARSAAQWPAGRGWAGRSMEQSHP
jgi:hypothetical protein